MSAGVRALGIALPLLLASCALPALHGDLLTLKKDLVGDQVPVPISGRVEASMPTAKPIIVVLFEEKLGKPTPAAYWVLHRSGAFAFLRPPGTYQVFAFEDENEDLAFQRGEPAGWYGKPSSVFAARGYPVEGLDVQLRRSDREVAARAVATLTRANLRALPRQRHAGDVTPLTDLRFSASTGKLGLWDPSLFTERYGMGIHFLQPFEPGKVPVLFVHGASGYPQEWAPLVSDLDRTRFQPWVFQYPSGQRLQVVSDALADLLDEIRGRYRLGTMFVVAHSMGGLVCRTAIAQPRVGADSGGVSLFVTISTPWQGHSAASLGVQHSPVVVPSWNDMAPGSAFLRALRASPLPSELAYHLFFGYRGGETLMMRENSDRSVTLQSMLDPVAQDEAVRLHGFFEDHQSILQSGDVSRALGKLLVDTADQVQRRAASVRR